MCILLSTSKNIFYSTETAKINRQKKNNFKRFALYKTSSNKHKINKNILELSKRVLKIIYLCTHEVI